MGEEEESGNKENQEGRWKERVMLMGEASREKIEEVEVKVKNGGGRDGGRGTVVIGVEEKEQ